MVKYMLVYQCGKCKVENKCLPEDSPIGWEYIPDKKVYLCPEHAKEIHELKKEE